MTAEGARPEGRARRGPHRVGSKREYDSYLYITASLGEQKESVFRRRPRSAARIGGSCRTERSRNCGPAGVEVPATFSPDIIPTAAEPTAFEAVTMGGGNAQKSAKARADKLAKQQKAAKGA